MDFEACMRQSHVGDTDRSERNLAECQHARLEISVVAGVPLGMWSAAFVLAAVFATCLIDLIVYSSFHGLS